MLFLLLVLSLLLLRLVACAAREMMGLTVIKMSASEQLAGEASWNPPSGRVIVVSHHHQHSDGWWWLEHGDVWAFDFRKKLIIFLTKGRRNVVSSRLKTVGNWRIVCWSFLRSSREKTANRRRAANANHHYSQRNKSRSYNLQDITNYHYLRASLFWIIIMTATRTSTMIFNKLESEGQSETLFSLPNLSKMNVLIMMSLSFKL